MCSLIVLIPLALVAHTHANDLAGRSDNYVDNLLDRALAASPVSLDTDLDKSAFGKPGHLQLSANRPSGTAVRPQSRVGSQPLGAPGRLPFGGVAKSQNHAASTVPQLVSHVPGRLPSRPLSPPQGLFGGPKTVEEVDRSVEFNFPGAISGPDIQAKLAKVLKDEYDFTPDNTIFGTSICPDEINILPGTMCDQAKNYWGTNFRMGGLGGVPFSGKTGFGAFSAHVPDGGNVLVLFGAHVGVTSSGEVGKVLRKGQSAESTSCGAFNAAYSQLLAGGIPDDFDLDMQQSYLRNAIAPSMDRIKKAANPMAELSKVAFEVILKKMTGVSNTGFGPGYLALVGGITLNMPKGYPDYFLPCYFTIQRGEGAPEDLLDKLMK